MSASEELRQYLGPICEAILSERPNHAFDHPGIGGLVFTPSDPHILIQCMICGVTFIGMN